MKYVIILSLALLVGPLSAAVVGVQTTEILIKRLQSTSSEVRKRASQQIYGGGYESTELYAALANAIESQLEFIDKNSPDNMQDEIAWHSKALASSGDMDYMPLLDELSKSAARRIARHAKKSKTLMTETAAKGHPYFSWDNVMTITESQADGCDFVDQQMCSTSRSVEKCVDWHKERAANAGANAIMLLYQSDSGVGMAWITKSSMMASYYNCSKD